MATSKKLNNITVTHQPQQVGVSFFFDDAPTDHFLLSLNVARKFQEKLTQAIDLASRPQAPGDGVSLSEHVSLSLSKPQEH